MQLQREKLELSPVFSTAMHHGDHTTGYIRLVNFSQKAAPEMHHAIADLQVQCRAWKPRTLVAVRIDEQIDLALCSNQFASWTELLLPSGASPTQLYTA